MIDESRVLYEDNHIIAIHKFASDIIQGDKTGDKPLSEHVKTFLKDKYNKPGNVFCGVIHRIDRPVSGVVPLDDYADMVIRGEAASDAAGTALDIVSDRDGDGLDEVLIGAPGDDTEANNAGAAYLILGSSL